ncbi:MAG TPA: hypothetical protein VFW33_06180, partial [Gemmataceae bacterium]|nr:hypothetical protein [Gemmataceae bacterium]
MLTEEHPMQAASPEEFLGRVLVEQRPRLLDLARKRLPPSLRGCVDEEDILSEVALRAQQRWPAFQARHPDGTAEEPPYDAWLTGLVRDCVIDAYRYGAAKKRAGRREESGRQRLSEIIGPRTGPGTALDRKEA